MYRNYPTSERPEIIEMIRDAVKKSPPVNPGPNAKVNPMKLDMTTGELIRKDAPPPASAPATVAPEAPYQPPPGSLDQGDRMLNIKTANQWLEEQRLKPAPRQLFGSLWLEGELCLLFADTNMGKSILAVQIGDSISRNLPIGPFGQDAAASPVLYIDFELSAKQFELRYRDAGGTHCFSDLFYRAEYNTQKELPWNYKTHEEYIQATLDWAIRNTEPKTLIIDNITCLSEGSNQVAAHAVILMKYLKALQTKNGLSILVLAHTPKRPLGKGIGRNDMGGSKMLMNFADSAFAIGQSQAGKCLRYLKQVKQRSGGQLYGEANICLMELERTHGLLHYRFCGYGHEQDHLRRPNDRLAPETVSQALQLHREGISIRQIARQLAISKSSVCRGLERIKGDAEDSGVTGG